MVMRWGRDGAVKGRKTVKNAPSTVDKFELPVASFLAFSDFLITSPSSSASLFLTSTDSILSNSIEETAKNYLQLP